MARRESLIRGAAAPGEHEPAPGAPAALDPAVDSPADEPRLSLFDAADLADPADPAAVDERLVEPSAAAIDPVPDVAGSGPALAPDDDPPLAELFPDDYVAEDATLLPEDATTIPDAAVVGPVAAIRPRTRRRKEPAPKPAPAPSPWLDPPPPVDHAAAAEPVHALAPPRSTPFVFDPLRPYRGVVRRFFVVYRHVLGLLAGGAAAYVRALPRERRHGLKSWFPRLTASIVWPFLDRDIRSLTFAQQLRRRLEVLGPTYIKLGQIMAIREDLLPRSITGELANLFDRLPAIPFVQVREIIEHSLGRPLEALYRAVDEKPLGSASIAQAHRAETLEGEVVVVKVIKPGVAEMIESDLTLLGMVGGFLQWVLPRYQPRQIIREFSAYTRKEVDYTFEADNAETFAANFGDLEDVAFPRIHRALSSGNVLTMEFMDGLKPGSQAAAALSQADRERVIDLGAASIIRMLYRDGFFHADLHAGNLMIFPGKRVKMGFIDLGMVGRFEERTRRQMLYYFHALVSGDVDGATRYLADMATVGKGGDPQGFRRAVTDLSRRFVTHASRGEISIAQLILESVGLGGRYRVFFPVEMTLMVKALVTFEGVGRTLDPQLDVAAVSQKHVSKIFQQQFDPRLLMRQILRGSPELVDMAVRLPQLLSAGFKFADEHLNNRSPANPLQGIKGSILAAACIVGGVLSVIQHASPWFSGAMFLLAVLLAAFGK
ncbi:MAG TPA: AarF/UbiB family protein [Longimicrobium sp.]|nr:AarF/UbiB family protein [Longimicrobium sp.]